MQINVVAKAIPHDFTTPGGPLFSKLTKLLSG